MDGGAYNPRTVEEVFRDFKGRRVGIIRALTTDVEEFYRACDPEKDNLSLYGFPTEQWEVNLPAEEVPPELPEPALGINFARDGMQEKDWLGMVAVHSDVWLISVAYFFGARFGFDKTDRENGTDWQNIVEYTAYQKRLFSMINELPTIFEIVSGKAGVKSQPTNHSNNKSKSNSKPKVHNSHPRPAKAPKKETKKEDEEEEEDQGGLDEERGVEEEEEDDDDEEEEEEEHGDTLCGACGEHYASDEFWICCDICEKWFHGKCVKVTPARAEHIKQYKCPTCSTNKRARPS